MPPLKGLDRPGSHVSSSESVYGMTVSVKPWMRGRLYKLLWFAIGVLGVVVVLSLAAVLARLALSAAVLLFIWGAAYYSHTLAVTANGLKVEKGLQVGPWRPAFYRRVLSWDEVRNIAPTTIVGFAAIEVLLRDGGGLVVRMGGVEDNRAIAGWLDACLEKYSAADADSVPVSPALENLKRVARDADRTPQE